ncbi:MAG: helix-turn-helix domain-containing protein [Motiliproteus sp.]
MNEDLSQNLRLLCSYYKSIAEVSRRLGISRPQFNRYLSGRFRPAANTLRRICDFFGLEEHEILLPHSQFERLVQVRPKQQNRAESLPEHSHLERLKQRGSAELDKYLGYYFEYYLSMAAPGKILRALVCFQREGDGIYYQRTERLVETTEEKVCHCKYLGMAFFLTDRIFMTDYESITANEITQTILFPTFKSRVTRLHGLRIGASASGERMPCSSRVILEYLGVEVDLRRALKMCSLYDFESEDIDDSIRQAVTNDNAQGQWHFRAK